jgi:hypothetical protein
MANSIVNQDLLKRIEALKLDMGNFFDIISRAQAQAGNNNELTDTDIKKVIQNDVRLYLNSPRIDSVNTDDDRARFEEAKQQVELNNQLRPLLSLIAGITPNLISELNNNPNQPQMGPGINKLGNDLLAHPKLAPFLDQAASSFLDAYKKIEAQQDSNDTNKQDDALKNANELSLQYKMMMKNSPKLRAEFENRMKLAPAPGYKPETKPRPF